MNNLKVYLAASAALLMTSSATAAQTSGPSIEASMEWISNRTSESLCGLDDSTVRLTANGDGSYTHTENSKNRYATKYITTVYRPEQITSVSADMNDGGYFMVTIGLSDEVSTKMVRNSHRNGRTTDSFKARVLSYATCSSDMALRVEKAFKHVMEMSKGKDLF